MSRWGASRGGGWPGPGWPWLPWAPLGAPSCMQPVLGGGPGWGAPCSLGFLEGLHSLLKRLGKFQRAPDFDCVLTPGTVRDPGSE